MNKKLQKVIFEFEWNKQTIYSAHWYPNGSEYFSENEETAKRKFEVSIFRGGGYKVSYYTDHRPCEKNSKEFIEQYLKSLQTTKQ